MNSYRLDFFTVIILSSFFFILYYILLIPFFDNNNFLFSNLGDDFYYINNSRFLDLSNFKLSGLVREFDITPYTIILAFIFKIGGTSLFQFIEFLLLVLCNYSFYKVSLHYLGNKYALIAFLFFLILPLRYLWALSFYRDSILVAFSVFFIHSLILKNHIYSFFSGLFLFLLRPVTFIILLFFFKFKIKKLNSIFLVVFVLIFLSFLSGYYEFILDSERIFVIQQKILQISFPFEIPNFLKLAILSPLLLIFTSIQPTFTFTDGLLIWDKIDPIARFDSVLKLFLVPPILIAFFNIKKYLTDIKINSIFLILIASSGSLLVAFLFLTNRHFLVFLPWQIILSIYVFRSWNNYIKNIYFLIYLLILLIMLIFFISTL